MRLAPSQRQGGHWCSCFGFQAVLVSDVMVDGGCAWRLAMMPLEFGFPLKAVTETLAPSEPVCARLPMVSFCLASRWVRLAWWLAWFGEVLLLLSCVLVVCMGRGQM